MIYVDLGRITQKEFDEAVPKLAEARGIIFDLRGYPQGITPQTIGHLIDKPVTCAQWHIPVTYSPDRRGRCLLVLRLDGATQDAAFQGQGRVPDRRPGHQLRGDLHGDHRALQARRDRGRPDRGHQRQCQPLHAAGRLQVTWTGMKVLKHDGSRHHGVGIQPTVPATRTIRGVTEGRDEVLDRAVAVVSP